MMYRQYYSELGKLLYAVADVDGVISQKEKSELRALVERELVPVEKRTDRFGTDVAFYAEIEFDIMEDSMIEPEDAFESFIDFVENHHTAINANMRDVTLKIAKHLGDAYHKTNKRERVLLQKLESKLKALPVK